MKNTKGKTPLPWATEGGYKEVVRELPRRDNIDYNKLGEGGKAQLCLVACKEYDGVAVFATVGGLCRARPGDYKEL